jgi:sialic acid synthase SpsE
VHKVFVVAEAGVNHNGALPEALRLVDAASACGADAVKFQLFDWQILKRKELEPLQLSRNAMKQIAQYCERRNIEFMCTPFDLDSMRWLAPLVKRMKIASGFVTDLPFLREAAKLGIPLILSTGMSTEAQARAVLDVLPASTQFLHCTSAYPCPLEAVNLSAIREYRFDGFSDHTQSIHIALAAVGMGATIIEKHLTLDKKAEGPDHASSINPREFSDLVRCIRDIEIAMGDGVKRHMTAEAPAMAIWRK